MIFLAGRAHPSVVQAWREAIRLPPATRHKQPERMKNLMGSQRPSEPHYGDAIIRPGYSADQAAVIVNMIIAAPDAALVVNVIKLQNMRLVGRARHCLLSYRTPCRPRLRVYRIPPLFRRPSATCAWKAGAPMVRFVVKSTRRKYGGLAAAFSVRDISSMTHRSGSDFRRRSIYCAISFHYPNIV